MSFDDAEFQAFLSQVRCLSLRIYRVLMASKLNTAASPADEDKLLRSSYNRRTPQKAAPAKAAVKPQPDKPK